ncbi:MAG: hypothetical protein ABIL92_04585 [candidate division WOR-3 bacterium]
MMFTFLFLILLLKLNFDIENSMGFEYDSNIFKLSSKEIQEFKTGLYPEKYPYNTLDDLKINSRTTFNLKSAAGCRWAFTVSIKQIINNPQKDFSAFSSSFFTSRNRVSLNIRASYHPPLLIRHYKPLNSTFYIPCKISRKQVSFKIGYKYKNAFLSTEARFWLDDYNKEFSYYDSRNLLFLLNFSTKPTRNTSTSLEYNFTTSKADGRNPDISYVQHGANFEFTIYPGKFRIQKTKLHYNFDYRKYVSDNPPQLDFLHAGRNEIYQDVGFEIQGRLWYGLYSILKVEKEWRQTYSKVYPDIYKLKNYRRLLAELRFIFRI